MAPGNGVVGVAEVLEKFLIISGFNLKCAILSLFNGNFPCVNEGKKWLELRVGARYKNGLFIS